MKRKLLLWIICLSPVLVAAQNTDPKEEVKVEKKFTAKFNGFVKSDFFWDTRQTVSAREGHFLLYPQPVFEDADGNDINSKSNFNFLSIQSRIGVDFTGPDVFNAKTSAKIEGDFFAQANDNINLFRLRHAFVKLNWPKTELLFGQSWIPMFITGCFPGTVSFNTGTPIQPFGRSPQIRATYTIEKVKLIGILSSQRDFANVGPAGPTGDYLRNSGIPAIDVQMHYQQDNKEAGTAFLFGIGGGYKTIVPRIKTVQNYSTDDNVSSFSGIAFLKIQLPAITLKFEGVFGQNIDNVLSIGGYAVKDSIDLIRGYVNYTPSNTLSFWTDIHTNGKFQAGIFAGFTKNNGFSDDIVAPSTIFGRGTSIESLFRVSPRMVYSMEHIRFALEGEFTAANYGDGTYDAKGIPQNTTQADNLRLLFSVYYFFK
ncbi:MAG: hypothetical protein P1P88_04265 [Bacteroidales bacterium]|nr:hypothetical protein [Bacteroidales bacterium]